MAESYQQVTGKLLIKKDNNRSVIIWTGLSLMHRLMK